MLHNELIRQCKAGNTDAVRSLILDKADINATIDGDFPLLLAAEANNLDLLDILLQAGADPSRIPASNETMLIVATRNGRSGLVSLLLQHSPAALLNARDMVGCTALFIAIQNNHVDMACALIDAGADATICNNNGTTTLMVCSDVSMARSLLELGVDIHARDGGGMDAVLFASEHLDMDMVDFLLSRGASGLSRDQLNKTALFHACRRSTYPRDWLSHESVVASA
jgi:ankyrin repeat protein